MRGYLSHLRQSRNPLCQQARRQIHASNGELSTFPRNSDSEENDSDTESSSSSNCASDTSDGSNPTVGNDRASAEACAFAGDFFGGPEAYADEGFGQEEGTHDEGDVTDVEGALDSDEDEIAAELEADAWEPLREGVPANIPLSAVAEEGFRDPMDIEEGPTAADHEHAAFLEMQARTIAETIIAGAGHGVKPASTVRYSEVHRASRVGQVLVNERTSDQRYESTVDSKSNAWAPFASKTDWEVARWAKLRGSKSTAFSDLLAVDGVSTLCRFCLFITAK